MNEVDLRESVLPLAKVGPHVPAPSMREAGTVHSMASRSNYAHEDPVTSSVGACGEDGEAQRPPRLGISFRQPGHESRQIDERHGRMVPFRLDLLGLGQ